MNIRKVSVAVVFALMSASVHAESLGIGSPAPKLQVKNFIKGQPVQEFEKGKIYVLEFWATWCGPCRAAMPHLSALQEQYKDLVFIGVDVLEQDKEAAQPLIQKLTDKMGYRVALDDVPEGKTASEGKMVLQWLRAAEQNGIPATFVVNKEGLIAWIGHPMELDAPLKKIVEDKWDIKAAAQDFKNAIAEARQMQALRQTISKIQRSGKPEELLAVLDQAMIDMPRRAPNFMFTKFRTLVEMPGKSDDALALGEKMMSGVGKENAVALNSIAWVIVESKQKSPPKLAEFASRAAKRANELTQAKDPGVLDTLARTEFLCGHVSQAIELEQKAVELAKGQEIEKDLIERLKKFQAELPNKK